MPKKTTRKEKAPTMKPEKHVQAVLKSISSNFSSHLKAKIDEKAIEGLEVIIFYSN